MRITSPDQQLCSSWSGGTTTQLAIFPNSASVEKRNFDWRISTARVELEESVFSDFSGYQRIFLSLDNPLVINHALPTGVLQVNLNPFESTGFDGSWKTTSKGVVTDFNVIFKPNYHPEVRVIDLNFAECIELSATQVFLYLVQGSLSINQTEISEKSFVVLDSSSHIKALSHVKAIVVEFHID
jgi:environmental stress-induced protein Ves